LHEHFHGPKRKSKVLFTAHRKESIQQHSLVTENKILSLPNISLVLFQKYDIAIGDITISSNRTSYVDFTLPYTESGVAMVVPLRNSINKKPSILLQPLKRDLWFSSSLLVIYTGVVVWLLEFLGSKTNARRPTAGKLGITAFFSLFGDS